MSNIFKRVLKTTPLVLGASLLAATSAMAEMVPVQEIGNQNQSDSMSQVTNVSEMRDVSPGDWAYEALRNLVERYGCIVGYPDQTFRGNRAMSRYEFAAGVNACLQQIERLIAANQAVTQEDLQKLQQLTTQFQTELVALGGRVDKLEGRTAFLEDHQFSTTTKLKGEVIFSLSSPFGEEMANGTGESFDQNPTFNYRARLAFNTSFTGTDNLLVRLDAANIPNYGSFTGTATADLSYYQNTNNEFQIGIIGYNFQVGEKVTVKIGAYGYGMDDFFASTYNPILGDDSEGAVSAFSRFNPALYRANSSSGIGVNYKFTDALNLDLVYSAANAANPNQGNGLFNGSYAAGVMLNWNPNEKIGVGVGYLRTYDPVENTNNGYPGTDAAIDPFNYNFDSGTSSAANRVGIQATWRVTEKINIGGWFGYVGAEGTGGRFDGDTADIFNGALNFALLDLAKEGSVLGFTFGVPPTTGFRTPDDTPFLIEAMYRYPLTDNISITPGAYVIINPNQNDNNDTIVVGTIRTTFKF